MKINIDIFKEAVQILQTNSYQDIEKSMELLANHLNEYQERVEKEYQVLRYMTTRYLDIQREAEQQKMQLQLQEVIPWIPLLQKHQETTVYPDAKKMTINAIHQAKKSMDGIDYGVKEQQLKLLTQAKKIKNADIEILKIRKQIFVLETSAKTHVLFNGIGQQVEGVAEFEIPKYYELFRKGEE